MLRLFTGVAIPPFEPLAAVGGELRQFGRMMRLEPPERWHITTTFLGDTDAELLPEIRRRIEVVAARNPRFETELRGLGVFPSLGRPTVVWTGLYPHEPWVRLTGDLASDFESLGFAREKRPFHPHLTIARVKGPPDSRFRGWFKSQPTVTYATLEIAELRLFSSELTSAGPVYTVLHSSPLAVRP